LRKPHQEKNMLPITAWKSGLAVTAFLAVPAAIFLPKHAAVPPADSAFTNSPPPDGTEAQYAKPSPFTTPPPKTSRRQKPATVATEESTNPLN
jgi:hypothetical protein